MACCSLACPVCRAEVEGLRSTLTAAKSELERLRGQLKESERRDQLGANLQHDLDQALLGKRQYEVELKSTLEELRVSKRDNMFLKDENVKLKRNERTVYGGDMDQAFGELQRYRELCSTPEILKERLTGCPNVMEDLQVARSKLNKANFLLASWRSVINQLKDYQS